MKPPIYELACDVAARRMNPTFIDIKGYGKIKIGADFYGEYEQVYINLSNFGVEIPDYVQKAIYDSNVHEDYKDNILFDNKFNMIAYQAYFYN